MEQLIILIVLAIPAAAVAALVTAVVALSRSNRLRARLDELEVQLVSRTPVPQPDATAAGPARPPRPEPPAPEPRPGPTPDTAPIPPPPEAPASPPPRPAPPPTPAAPPVVTTAARPARPPRSGAAEWERWIGVRGAAAVGGVVLALAALLLFKYSVDHGLISPAIRVTMGIVAGLICLGASEWLHKRNQRFAANALSGAGAVALYAALWAARSLYGLIPLAPAAVLMVLVTATCGLIAVRRGALLTAVLGLVGGFATPLLVGEVADQPLTLFSYILLLDAGLLWLARRKSWPALASLSLAGTALYQLLWIGRQMDASEVLLGLVILALFAAVFVAAGALAGAEKLVWRLTEAGALLIPLALALHMAARSQLAVRPIPLVLLLALLTVMAMWLSRREARSWPALAAVGTSLGVVTAWLAQNRLTPTLAWEVVLAAAGLALAVHLMATTRRLPEARMCSLADPLLAGGLLAILTAASVVARTPTLWTWLTGWTLLGAVIAAHALRMDRPRTLLGAAVGPTLALGLYALVNAGPRRLPPETLVLAAVLAFAMAFHVVRSAVRAAHRRGADHAAAAAAITLLLTTLALAGSPPVRPLLELATATALALLAAAAAARLTSGVWYAAAVAGAAIVHTAWAVGAAPGLGAGPEVASSLVLAAVTVLLFTAWPALAHPAFVASRTAWAAAALAGPVFFVGLRRLWRIELGDGAIGLLPLGLAALCLLTFRAARPRLAVAPVRRSATVWLLAVALCLVSVAIPLQLDKAWITIGWALNGIAVLLLWRRFDSPGLKYLGLALLGAAAVRLTLNPAVLGYHPRGRLPVLNWVLYTYWVPAAALIAAWSTLKSREIARLRGWEKRLLGGRAGGAAACALAALAVIFAWINLAVVDLFSSGPTLALTLERRPARDVALSIAWAVYALVILALGMRRRSGALRWLSLALLVVTLGKAFLYDLGHLEDLYRVGSLVGLAVSLILVSLAYQRFVLRRSPEAGASRATEEP